MKTERNSFVCTFFDIGLPPLVLLVLASSPVFLLTPVESMSVLCPDLMI
jgi:hypothetical protein